MSEFEKILKENMEEYESALRQAQKYVAENRSELSPRYAYAGYLKQPVKENQIFFLWDKNSPDAELPRKLSDYVQRERGKEYTCIYCEAGSRKPSAGSYVKQDSAGYWEALACSKYIVSSVALPLAFVKRAGQVYLNAMWEALKGADRESLEWVSLTSREMMKADYLYAPSEKEAKSFWKEKAHLGFVWEGRVLIGKPQEEAGEMAEILLGIKPGAGETHVKALPLRNPEKKKLLVLTSWKAPREQKALLKILLNRIDREAYDVAVLSSWANEPSEFQDFMSLKRAAKLMYRGRMVLEEKDFLTYRILEKSPDMYVKYGEIRGYLNSLMEQEWGRILGNSSWDVCLVLGSAGYLQYYLAAKCPAKKKVLVDTDFLSYIKEKNPAKWRTGVTVFDRIYAPAGSLSLGTYGMENRLRAMYLPVIPAEKPTEEPETVSYKGKNCLICDKWKTKEGRLGMKLVKLPEKGSYLVNADLLPDEERKKVLKTFSEEHKLYLLGANVKSCQSFLPQAEVLEEFVRQELPLLPAAWSFFGRFAGYLGDRRLERDVTGEVCRSYGVPTDGSLF